MWYDNNFSELPVIRGMEIINQINHLGYDRTENLVAASMFLDFFQVYQLTPHKRIMHTYIGGATNFLLHSKYLTLEVLFCLYHQRCPNM